MSNFTIGGITAKSGTRKDDLLEVAPLPDGNVFGIPMIIINGVKPGPVLFINSGTHGDEPEGTLAITDLAKEIDPKKLTGTLVLMPVLNVPAFMGKVSVDVSGLRENPLDWKNLGQACLLIKFVKNLLVRILLAVVSTLKGVKEVRSLHISLRRKG